MTESEAPPTPPPRSVSLCRDNGSSQDWGEDLRVKLARIEREYPEIYYRQMKRAYEEMVSEIRRNVESSQYLETIRKLRECFDVVVENPSLISQVIDSLSQWTPRTGLRVDQDHDQN
jgi:hypothetical protein